MQKKQYLFFILLITILNIIFLNNINVKVFNNLSRNLKIFLKKSYYSNCHIKQIKEIPKGSTIITGHIYKDSFREDYINKNLLNFLSLNKDKIQSVILTGDIFEKPDKAKWENLHNHFKNIKVFIAPGNHDIGLNNNELFNSFKNSKFYLREFPYKISESNHEIILEDSISNRWIIDSKTIELINQVNKNERLILARHNIPASDFIFLANSSFGKSKKLPNTNKLNNLINRQITIISGDSGNSSYLPRVFCSKRGKITFIFNGLGGFKNDSVLILHNKKIYRYLI